MTKIKICGITNLDDALAALELGVDALGFVFAESPRNVTPDTVEQIVSEIALPVLKVGVFVNEAIEKVQQIFEKCSLDYVQLSGNEDREYIEKLGLPAIKIFKVKDQIVLMEIPQYDLNLFMLDSFNENQPGGTGKTFNWDIAKEAKLFGRVILSGGLTPENVFSALQHVEPYGVDVSSGVEELPGKKDKKKLAQFVKEVRRWDYQTI